MLQPHEGIVVGNASDLGARFASDLWYRTPSSIACRSAFHGCQRWHRFPWSSDGSTICAASASPRWPDAIQTSPHRDDRYDVSDYYSVDSRYGALGDFVDFTHGAKQRDIRVLIDLVVNHL